ncbi:MAG: SDR family NAD(P)-dependent oxidoreductase [Desulfobacteraceae bacterium]|nr:SDR family NAD(P)-dependent oxidoreductase [Desulfobacteraceae bacterium]
MSLPNFSLEGKVGLVTGGSRGLGRAMALIFAEAGADIAISDIDPSELNRTTKEVVSLGRRSLAIQADISKKANVDSMVDKTLKEFGTIDILVNNAAITIERPLLEYTEDEWDRVLDVDLKGYFLCTQAIARIMMPKRYLISLIP